MFVFAMAAWVPDDKARAFASDVRDAIDATLTRKEAWQLMGLTNEGDLSAQLHCQKPLNAFRLIHLPDATLDDLQRRMAERRGAMFLSAGFVLLLHGAAAIGRKRMAKVAPPMRESAERKRA